MYNLSWLARLRPLTTVLLFGIGAVPAASAGGGVAASAGVAAAPAKPHVRVTSSWDDGHRNDVRVAAILRQYKAKGTFFIVPENYALLAKDPKAALEKEPFLITPFEKFVEAYQGFEIGAHGFQHLDMRTLKPEELRFQLTASKSILATWFKQPVQGMAYPGGAYNDTVEAAVRDAGYVYARTVDTAPAVFPVADPYALKVSLHVNDPKFWEEFERVKAAGGVFYFWGHSYEFKTEADWKAFEAKVARLSADPAVEWVTNLELFQ